jgi:hypothetical protein
LPRETKEFPVSQFSAHSHIFNLISAFHVLPLAVLALTPAAPATLLWHFLQEPKNDFFSTAIILGGPSGTLAGQHRIHY